MAKEWKVLSSKYLVERPWAVLRWDVCEMPNGTIVPEYYVLEYPNWVNVVALTEENQVVLIRQYRHGAGKSFLEIPAGVVEKGEDPAEAARRELLEETGYAFSSVEFLCELYPNPATSNNVTTSYLARGGKKVQEQELDAQEDIEVQLYSIEEVRTLLQQNKILQALHASSLFYALARLDAEK